MAEFASGPPQPGGPPPLPDEPSYQPGLSPWDDAPALDPPAAFPSREIAARAQ